MLYQMYTIFLKNIQKIKKSMDECALGDLECLYLSHNSFNQCLLLDTNNLHIISDRSQKFNDYNKYHIDAINRVDMLSDYIKQYFIKMHKTIVLDLNNNYNDKNIIIVDMIFSNHIWNNFLFVLV